MAVERITEKHNGLFGFDSLKSKKVANKLGHTEDIEEKHNMSIDEMDAYITEHKKIEQELGIELNVLFKAIKQKDIFHKTQQGAIKCFHIYHLDVENLALCGYMVVRCVDSDSGSRDVHLCLKLKDYEKTWALTKEELEK